MSSLIKSMGSTRLPTQVSSVDTLFYIRPAILAALALVASGCSSSGGSDTDNGTSTGTSTGTGTGTGSGSGSGSEDSGSTAGQMEENTTGTGSNTEADFPSFQGVFDVYESYSGGVRRLDMGARFLESDTRLILGHQFLLGQDRCQENLNSTGVSPEAISAGDVLVLSNQEGTLAQLDGGQGSTKNYTQQLAPVTAAQTTGMTLDIPGDQYPGLPTLPVQDLDGLSGIQPDIGSTVAAQTVFKWEPSIHPDTIIGINLNAFVNSFNVSVSCTVEDDGEFILPDSFQSLLGDTSSINWSISRSRYVEHIENGAYLEISRTIQADTE